MVGGRSVGVDTGSAKILLHDLSIIVISLKSTHPIGVVPTARR